MDGGGVMRSTSVVMAEWKKNIEFSLDPPYFDQFVPSLKMLIFGENFW